MKKIIGIGLLVLMASCSSIFSPDQKVIMSGDPFILSSTDYCFFIGGHVQNISDQTINFVEIIIYLNNSNWILLSSGKSMIDKAKLFPGEKSSWNIYFYDPDKSIRNKMDFSRLAYKINIQN